MKKCHEKCFFCKGNMEKRKITVDYWWKGELVLIEKVPAWICTQCGEEVFEGPVAEQMEKVAKAKTQKRTLAVPVKSFEETSSPVLA